MMAYFSNGSEGEVLDTQCSDCPLGYGWNNPQQRPLFEAPAEPRPCPTALVQSLYNYEQIGPDGQRTKMSELMNLLVNERGECQTRKILLQIREETAHA